MADEIVVQYRFRDETTGFADAIVLPLDDFLEEYGPLSKPHADKIEAAKAERLANWQAALSAPRPEPTKAEVEAEAAAFIEDVKARQAVLSERLLAVGSDLVVDVAVDDVPVKGR